VVVAATRATTEQRQHVTSTREWIKMNRLKQSLGLGAAILTVGAMLSGCGGGLEVVVGPGGGYVRPNITDKMAVRLTAASIGGGPTSMLVPASSMLTALNKIRSDGGYRTRSVDVSSYCSNPSGSMQMQITDTDASGSFTQGDIVSVTFTNCSVGSGASVLRMNGALDLTVNVSTVAGDTVSSLNFTSRGLAAILSGTTASYSGSLAIEYTYPGGVLTATPRIAYVSAGLEIAFAGSTRIDRISNARWGYASDTTYAWLSPKQTVTLTEFGVASRFDVDTLAPLQVNLANGNYLSGRVEAVGLGDYQRIRLVGTNLIEIALDGGDDGYWDRFLNTDAPSLLLYWN
jgi:hypothetical protein